MADSPNGKELFNKYGEKRPVKKSTGEKIKDFIWNSETGEFCGRTGSSWFKITLFYVIFYICLSIFFMICFMLFWKISITRDRPRWTLDESIIGSNPGVGFRPMPDQDNNVESTLIWINRRDDTSVNASFWAMKLNDFFVKEYKLKKTTGQDCSYENGARATADNPCEVDIEMENGCKNIEGYGYVSVDGGKVTPCILIKLNKIFDWEPQPYNIDDLKDAKERGMPGSLVKKIEELSKKGDTNSLRQIDTTWISCEGENPTDKEYMGEIEYWAPGFKEQFQGIPNYYFPYTMQANYKAPFVFVKFLNPAINTLIQIECKAWAKNIKADRFQRLGSVHFEIMID